MTTIIESPPEKVACQQEPPAPRRVVTVEHLIYLSILVVALILHLWGQGSRALHHDETHHAYFPWLLYTGKGYVHDPLLHGPFLYFINAFFYLLLGDSDFTSRLSAALFGTALTVLPWLLRRELGRLAALLASIYLLISPVALYVGRFIRHDIFAVTFEVLCVVGLVRYVATRRPAYLYLFSASFALMVTTMETSYLFALILGSFLLGLVIWHVDRRLVLLFLPYLLLIGAAKALLPAPIGSDGKPMPLVTDTDALLIRNRPDDYWLGYMADLGRVLFGHQTRQTTGQEGYNGLFLHYWVPVAIGLTVLLAALLIWLIFFKRDEEGRSAWRRAVDNAAPETLLPALDTLRGRRVLIALAIFFTIYATLFTSFFFNTVGLLSGVSGSFLYWLGQHDVRRGGQPGHYYVVLLSIYEPMLVVWGFGGALLGMWYGLRRLLRDGGLSARTMLPPLLAWWSLSALAVYSWAGEKMPWLTLHLVVPLTLTAAWAATRILRRLLAGGESRRALLFYVGASIALGVFSTIWMNTIVQSSALADSSPRFLLFAAVLGLLLILGYLLWLIFAEQRAARAALARAAGATLLAISLLLGAYAVRSAWRLAYINGDVPVEMMVYVQTTPDVARVMRQLREVSIRQTGGLDIGIRYDNETIWKWYLRNYRHAQTFSGTLPGRPDDSVQVVFLYDANMSANEPLLTDFVKLRLPMRWWFPESETYRLSTLKQDQSWLTRFDDQHCPKTSLLDRLLCSPTNAQTINQVWSYLLFRQPPAPLGSVDFAIYVRPEIADGFMLSPVSEK